MADSDQLPDSTDATGSQPDVSSSLKPKGRVVANADQAEAICNGMITDSKRLILNAARITAKIDGERPRPPAELLRQNKGWKSNVSTRFLANELTRIVPRYTRPLQSAKFLTAARLPQLTEDGTPWPDGDAKTDYFRQEVTRTIRNWKKWKVFQRGLAREVGAYGFGYATWGDYEFEWRPTLKRMDKGFVPKGTEVTDDPVFFCYKMDYSPGQLLKLAAEAKESGVSHWKDKAVAEAINSSKPTSVAAIDEYMRDYVSLVRQATETWAYEKGYKVVRTKHLFAKELDGSVTHIILWDDKRATEEAVLYWKDDAFKSMRDVVVPVLFDYGDGTIHGVWGAGQLLYDLAVKVEETRNDGIDNTINANRVKVQTSEGKDVTAVKLAVQDNIMVVAGGTYAGNVSGIGINPEGYTQLDQRLTTLAQQNIGSYVPPIPVNATSDIKAAQINAQLAKEEEVKNDNLSFWLEQVAEVIWVMTRRMLNPDTPDEEGKACRERLEKKLTKEEIELLVSQPPVETIIDFTDVPAGKRAQFAASVLGNPLFNQAEAARIMAEGVDGPQFAQTIVMPSDDDTIVVQAQQKQILEASAMAQGLAVPVATTDNHVVHMDTLRPMLEQGLAGGSIPLPALTNGLNHFTAHFQAGIVAKSFDDVRSNDAKSFIANFEKAIRERAEQEALLAQQQAAAAGGAPVIPMQGAV